MNAAAPGIGLTALIAQDWLKTWSIDLQVLGQDHDVRNLSSYRPQELKLQSRPDLRELIKSLLDLWKACEPSTFGRFSLLDMYLLRNALVKLFDNIPTTKTFSTFIDDTLNNLGMPPNNQLRNFLLKKEMNNEHPILREAKKKGLVNNYIIRPISVASRALLLLRLATATTNKLLQNTVTTKDDLEFWWDTKGKQTGLWANASTPTDMSDLWADIEDIFDPINTWLLTATANSCVSDSRKDLPFELWELSKVQLAGFWGMWD